MDQQEWANDAVAAHLAEIAALVSTRRGERYRARAFRSAGRVVGSLPVDVATLGEQDLQRLDGIGTSVGRAISESLAGTTPAYLQRLRADHPPGFGQLIQVMGVSPKVARNLIAAGVDDLDRLTEAAQRGSLTDVAGVGERTAEVIRDGIERVRLSARSGGRPVLREARLDAEQWASRVAVLEGVDRAVVTGEIRRGVPQPDGLEVVAVLRDPRDLQEVAGSVVSLDGIVRPIDSDTRGRVVLLTTSGRRLAVHLVTADEAATAVAADEPAEGLVSLSDIIGDGHVHTEWSGDGHDTIDTLARAAVARGYDWIALTDHAENLSMNGLSREALRDRDLAIDAARRRHPDVELRKGLELNIGLDGSVDYDPDVLAGQDWCVASIHSTFQRSAAVQTDRILAAIANPHVDVIGHPTGRMLGVRSGYGIEITAIAQAAAETGTALEVNGSPRRLDLDAELVAVALEAGARLAISSDAHRAEELDYMVEAVLTAGRGGARPADVVNAHPRTWTSDGALSAPT